MLEREEIIGLLVGLVIGLIGGLLFGFTMGVQSISTTPKIYAWNNTIM